jgi:hypothetical protein
MGTNNLPRQDKQLLFYYYGSKHMGIGYGYASGFFQFAWESWDGKKKICFL